MNFGQTSVRLVQAGIVLAAAALVAGCGNNYRPTVIPINSPGPAAQPTSNVLVVSAPSPTTAGIATIVDYSGDSIMASASIGVGPKAFSLSGDGSYGYTLNRDGSLTAFPITTGLQNNQVVFTTLASTAQPMNLFTPSGAVWAPDVCGSALNKGCGVYNITQTALAGGVATYNWTLVSGVAPVAGQLVRVRGTVNAAGALNVANAVVATVSGTTSGIFTVNGFTPSSTFTAAAETGQATTNQSVIDIFIGSPSTLQSTVPLAPTPVTVMGAASSGLRYYAISQGNSNGGDVFSGVACNLSPTTGPLGEASGIEAVNRTISSRISLGKCPVYAVLSSDTRRLFVLNRGSDTITVINAQNNALDQCPVALVPAPLGSGEMATCPAPYNTNQAGQPITYHPNIPLSLTAVNALNAQTYGLGNTPNGTTGMLTTAGPVYAEYNAATNQLVVADYDGGTISVIDVSLDEYGNDSATFGTTFTVPVGNYPASVTVLNDGSRAYTANQTDQTVSIVNLVSHTVEKVLPVTGNPRTVASTQNSTQGKVYVASPNTNILTIIRTDQDIVDTTLLMQGDLVDVRVTTQDAVRGNSNAVSRTPGYGQPCNLPPALMSSTYGANYTLANCQNQP